MAGDGVSVLGVGQRMEHPSRDGRQRRDIPRRRVVPYREHLLELSGGGRRRGGRVNHTVAAETPDEPVVEPQILATDLHVVTATPVVRGTKVVANGLRVLKNVLVVRA